MKEVLPFLSGSRKVLAGRWIAVALVVGSGIINAQPSGTIGMSLAELKDHVKGGWLGKTGGISIGAPTEFNCTDWNGCNFNLNMYPDMAEGFNQDDMYGQISYIEVMDNSLKAGKGIFSAKMTDYGQGLKNSTYGLCHGNEAARNNLQSGILPPHSGMWGGPQHRYSQHAADIDWQIECDWMGIGLPGLPNVTQRLNDTVGHVLSYADGLYGGCFIATMSSLAYVKTDIHDVVRSAVKNLPSGNPYTKCVKDIIAYHDSSPARTWQSCLNATLTKYSPLCNYCPGGSCGVSGYGISATVNGIAVVIGLLYGDNDVLKAIQIAADCGYDSDCNPANAGAVMGVSKGYAKLPAQWRTSIENHPTDTYSGTSYTFSMVVDALYAQAKKAIVESGGRVTADSCFIKIQTPTEPRILELWGEDPKPNPASTSIRDDAVFKRSPNYPGSGDGNKVLVRGSTVTVRSPNDQSTGESSYRDLHGRRTAGSKRNWSWRSSSH